MARSPSQMAETLSGLGRLTELRQRLLFVFAALIIYRIGTFIPVPGVNPQALLQFMNSQQGTIVDVFNLFTGGALERFSLFALGVMPYISASIIMQLMSSAVPQLQQLKKEGSSGRQKITQYTRNFTVILAADATRLERMMRPAKDDNLVTEPGYFDDIVGNVEKAGLREDRFYLVQNGLSGGFIDIGQAFIHNQQVKILHQIAK